MVFLFIVYFSCSLFMTRIYNTSITIFNYRVYEKSGTKAIIHNESKTNTIETVTQEVT